MRQRYRNKRDFYKGQMEAAQAEVERLKKQLVAVKLTQQKPEERYSAITFCTECRVVTAYQIVRGTSVSECSCLRCGGRRTLLSVTKVEPSAWQF